MNLLESNPHLRSPSKRKKLLHQFAKQSSAIEGIRHPFAEGKRTYWPETMDELVNYWKQRVAASARSRKRKGSRAVRNRGSSPSG
jgi:hypothetical protein